MMGNCPTIYYQRIILSCYLRQKSWGSMLVSITQWVIDSRHHPSAWNCLNHRKTIIIMYVLLLPIIIILIIIISRIPAWIGRWGQRPHTLHFLCNAPKLLCTPEICVWAAHQNSGPIKCILCCREGCLNANFSGWTSCCFLFATQWDIMYSGHTWRSCTHGGGEYRTELQGSTPDPELFCLYLYLYKREARDAASGNLQ